MKLGSIFTFLTTSVVLFGDQLPTAMAREHMSLQALDEIVQRCGSQMYDTLLLKESATHYEFSMSAFADGSNPLNCPILQFDITGAIEAELDVVAIAYDLGEVHDLGHSSSLREIAGCFASANAGRGANTTPIEHLEHMYECLGHETDDAILTFVAEGPSRKLSTIDFALDLVHRRLSEPVGVHAMNKKRLEAIGNMCGNHMYLVMLMKESVTTFEYSMVAFPEGTNIESCPPLDIDINGVVKANVVAMELVLKVGEFYHLGQHSLNEVLTAFEFANESGVTTPTEHLEHMYENLGYQTNDGILNFIADGPSETRRLRGSGVVRYLSGM
jgi:hypothetical protein